MTAPDEEKVPEAFTEFFKWYVCTDSEKAYEQHKRAWRGDVGEAWRHAYNIGRDDGRADALRDAVEVARSWTTHSHVSGGIASMIAALEEKKWKS